MVQTLDSVEAVRMKVRVVSPVLVLAAALASMGQTTGPASVGPAPLRFFLMDGSQVSGKLSVADLTVETAFGTLKVPIDSIKSFSPGLSSHPEFQKKLSDLVSDLGADGFAEREKAQQALLKMGAEIEPELKRQLRTAEAERQTRLQKILEEFDSQRDDSDPEASAQDWMPEDAIVTNSFTIVGRITTPGFSVTSQYGTLQLKLADVRRAQRESAEPEEIKKTVSVSGTLIASRSFETALKVNRGDQVTITATGTINMTPWGGNMSSGPDGGGNFGNMQPGNIPGGALIAKVGSAIPFKVGSKHTFTVEKAGVLQFGIAIPGEYTNYQFPGEYQVKVRVVRKQGGS
jgi:hypothetical protein